MLIRCIDFETTGIPTEEDPQAICEIGFTDVVDDVVSLDTVAMLVNPGRPMPVEAQAVHHISDADLIGAPPITDGLQLAMQGPPDFFAAHNADYEQAFFAGGGVPWIDTYKVALRLWPEAPSHSQQVLRYYLGLDLFPERAAPAPSRHLRQAQGDALGRTAGGLSAVDCQQERHGRRHQGERAASAEAEE